MSHTTLAQALDTSKVGWARLEQDFAAELAMVRALIGVAPNCDCYLEIWPPAFRAYNLLVPNGLNLPGMLFGLGAPKDLVGLAMYASSRAAECMYCSAHTCSFALRRGASEAAILGHGTDTEQAVVAFAEALGRLPTTLEPQHLETLRSHLSDRDREWVLWGVALMGFLGKFMDAMGVQLEPEAIGDVQALISATGWSPGKHSGARVGEIAHEVPHNEVPVDNLRLYGRVLRRAPTLILTQQRMLSGFGSTSTSALKHLEEKVGYGFPRLRSRPVHRPVVALAAVLCDQLNPKDSPLGLRTKLLLGLVYAATAQNTWLQEDLRALLQVHCPDVDKELRTVITTFANAVDEEPPSDLPELTRATLRLGKCMATSPAELSVEEIARANSALTAPQVIEAVTWLAVLQLVHRLYTYQRVAEVA